MEQIILEYDKKNKAALKFIEFIKEIGLFKIRKEKTVNAVTEKALNENENKKLKKHSSVKSVMNDLNK
jgi:hypothetical protein